MRLGLIVNTGVQTLVIVVVKIVGDAGLRVGQVGKKGALEIFSSCAHRRAKARSCRSSAAVTGLSSVLQVATGVRASFCHL
jgi:hypothetical protein